MAAAANHLAMKLLIAIDADLMTQVFVGVSIAGYTRGLRPAYPACSAPGRPLGWTHRYRHRKPLWTGTSRRSQLAQESHISLPTTRFYGTRILGHRNQVSNPTQPRRCYPRLTDLKMHLGPIGLEVRWHREQQG